MSVIAVCVISGMLVLVPASLLETALAPRATTIARMALLVIAPRYSASKRLTAVLQVSNSLQSLSTFGLKTIIMPYPLQLNDLSPIVRDLGQDFFPVKTCTSAGFGR